MAIAIPKGTRDFYPDEMYIREYIFQSWEKSCKKYGFEKIDAPLFEHLELYTKKSGAEIEKQLYSFDDKGGRKLSLRPEMTPSLARMVAAKGSALKKPIRWYSIPRLFRYEKMQKGRLREFFQLNLDILGIDSVSADAELIAVSIDMMRNLGFESSDFTVHISSRNLLEELFLQVSVPKDKLEILYGILDKQHKMSPMEFNAKLTAIIKDNKTVNSVESILKCKSINEIRAIYPDTLALTDLDELFRLLSIYGMTEYVEFNIGIVRGLAYYTGIVFEMFDKQRSLRAIAGGGRYDDLVGLYGGLQTPATGFAAGDVVLYEMMKSKGILPHQPARSDIFIINLNRDDKTSIISLAQVMRKNNISCEFALKFVGIGKQMKQANAARAHIVIFIGGEEEADGNIKIKTMSDGTEIIVALTECVKKVKVLLQ